ncbi:MAG: SusD/RagB family nutrient-binding outer membrane lipoprotein [Bacteroidetes bacterium]|nr:SusD/RagB family nutrient-binding outer membrane lipoprotein [Bacteroidota bacterium]
MKRLNIIGLFILTAFLVTSCDKWINPDYNTDPNRPSEVTLPILLPSAEVGLAYQLGGDLGYATRCWMQQLAGGANQPLAYDRYNITSGDVDNMWKWGMYAGPLMDANRIILQAETQKAPRYAGIAKVLMAYGISTMSDLFGSVPYKEAFQGSDGILKPKYETQEEIYTMMLDLLDAAVVDLATADADNSAIPDADDLVYAGNMAKWTKAAYTIKARLYLHLAKRNGAVNYTNALNALSHGITNNTEDFEVYFGAPTNENNPLAQFVIDQRIGDIVMGKFLVDKLVADADPRLLQISGGTNGIPAGVGGTGDNPGPFYASYTSPVPFSTFVEAKFIEAECKFQNDKAGAALAYNAAVIASLAKMGVSDATWEAAHANESVETISLDKIINAKYVAMSFQIEVFNDWRRTGLPTLTLAANNVTSNVFPRRYPYPTDEKIYNSANCPTTGVSVTDRVWWDVP